MNTAHILLVLVVLLFQSPDCRFKAQNLPGLCGFVADHGLSLPHCDSTINLQSFSTLLFTVITITVVTIAIVTITAVTITLVTIKL